MANKVRFGKPEDIFSLVLDRRSLQVLGHVRRMQHLSEHSCRSPFVEVIESSCPGLVVLALSSPGSFLFQFLHSSS